jgi:hypothetical protein
MLYVFACQSLTLLNQTIRFRETSVDVALLDDTPDAQTSEVETTPTP